MIPNKGIKVFSWIVTVCMTLPGLLWADLCYEQVSQRSGAMISGLSGMIPIAPQREFDKTSLTVYVKGNRCRLDEFVGKELVRSRIYSIPRRELLWLYHEHRNYRRLSFEQFRKMNATLHSSPKTGKMKVEGDLLPRTSLEETQKTERILGIHSQLYHVSTGFQNARQSTAAIGEIELVSDVWLGRDDRALKEMDDFRKMLFDALGKSDETENLLPPSGMLQDTRVQIGLEEIYRLARDRSAIPLKIHTGVYGLHPAHSNVTSAAAPPPSDPLNGRKELTASKAVHFASHESNADGVATKIENPSASSEMGRDISGDRGALRRQFQFYRINIEVQKISRDRIPDSLFRIPNEYSNVDDSPN